MIYFYNIKSRNIKEKILVIVVLQEIINNKGKKEVLKELYKTLTHRFKLVFINVKRNYFS